ncbi:MAG: hypothetical protein U9R53_02690 [Chloroflexota bacterium]|nr:hypothetical protein [Chloroflexota bacterium]
MAVYPLTGFADRIKSRLAVLPTVTKLFSVFKGNKGKKLKVANLYFHPADVWVNCPEISPAEKAMSWEAWVSLDAKNDRQIYWHNKEREWASQIETL